MRLRAVVLVTIPALMVASCGDDDAGDSTTSISSVPSTDVVSTLATSTTATLSDLTGSWGNEVLVLEVNSGGEFIIALPDDSSTPVMGGFVARDGDQFSFVTSTSGECPGQTGVYRADVSGDVLTLTLVDDPCQVRASGFEEELAAIN